MDPKDNVEATEQVEGYKAPELVDYGPLKVQVRIGTGGGEGPGEGPGEAT